MSAVTDFYSFTRNKIRWAKYVITDAPSFCKDLFSLKCNQFTMRDCALKNFAISYIDGNTLNAEKGYRAAVAKGDAKEANRWWYIGQIMTMYVDVLEKRKEFLVNKSQMSNERVAEINDKRPSLFRQAKQPAKFRQATKGDPTFKESKEVDPDPQLNFDEVRND